MPIIIKIGRLPEILWALFVLTGFVLASSGVFNAYNGITDFGNTAYTSSAAISYLSGDILMFVIGLVVITAWYFGIRGKIIIVRSTLNPRALTSSAHKTVKNMKTDRTDTVKLFDPAQTYNF